MIKYLSIVLFAGLSSAAMAQDYGLEIGVHETTAAVNTSESGWLAGTQGSTSGSLGFDLGLAASFELVPNLRFRSGVLYDLRPFQYKVTSQGASATSSTVNVNFSYIDVPIDLQYNFTPMFGIFGGMVVGIDASNSNSGGPTGVSPNTKSLYPLLNGGASFTFDDMIGFDLYYEYGLGDFADNLKNYSTFGLRFVYWL